MTRTGWTRAGLLVLVGLGLAAGLPREAHALITGGKGNMPLPDPGWPRGAAALFNHPGRVAWWEGPPFGGGQWHSECRGDAKALSAVLADFARLEVANKRVVVHDGVGNSFWLNANREADKAADARVDWVLMVWQPANWERLGKMPAGLDPTDPADREKGPPARIDVYAGGNIKWADVVVPDGLALTDERLEAHGFTVADGTVFEGTITDVTTGQPVVGKVRLERVQPLEKGGYAHPLVADADADAKGRWVLKKVPAGWSRMVVEAAGYVPRVVGYAQPDEQPRWASFDGALARPAEVSGRVADDTGQPLAGVSVRFDDVTAGTGGRYELPGEASVETDADGRFRASGLPAGHATVWIHKPGYCRPGLGQPIATPAADLALVMQKAAQVRVSVDFHGVARPQGYIVEIEPEGGSKVGSWGGSGQIDDKNGIDFRDVPPGRYVFRGKPNPSSGDDTTLPVTVELKGGEKTTITLQAK